MKILLIAVVGLLFLGCQTQPHPKTTPTSTKAHKTSKVQKNTKKVLPKWINNPDFGGNVGAVGVVKLNKNKKKQKYIAKRLAIAQLMERKSVQVSSEYTSNDGGKVAHHTQRVEEQTDGMVVDEFEVKDEYSDGKNYYLWVVIKK